MDKRISFLTDDEFRLLIQRLGESSPDGTFTDDDAIAAVTWAQGVHRNEGLLAGVLRGEVGLRIRDGEPTFAITEAGMRDVEQQLAASPDLQQLHDEVVARFAKTPLGKGPKDPQ